MAYRVNMQFKDGVFSWPFADVVAGATPRRGETISVARHGVAVPARVIAIWTPSAKVMGPRFDGLVMVEAREI